MRRWLPSSAVVFSLGLFVVALGSGPSFAGQDSSVAPPKPSASPARSPRRTGWVLEIHLGSMPGEVPSKVRTSQLPPAGPSFTTVLGDPSRRVPSWYFGDGALLANQVAAFTGDPGRIVPLDPVLTSASASRRSGADFGIRVGHTITGRVLLLFSFDQVAGRLALAGDAVGATKATTASFMPYWDAVLTRSSSANVSTSSTLTITDDVGTEKLMSVAAEVRVITIHGWTPYVAVGGGIAWPSADGPTVTLVGHYQFMSANDGAPFNETDQVQLRYQAQPRLMGILGAGVKRDLARHIGVRAELRSFLGANALRIRLDTQPVSAIAPPFGVTRRGVTPSLQISTLAADPTSLSLQGVDHFNSFEGVGNLLSFSAGFFLRF